jgi:transcriptional regulator with XRE-family HTH domain
LTGEICHVKYVNIEYEFGPIFPREAVMSDEYLAKQFFKNAEKARIVQKMSQRFLASIAGITPSYYNDLKTGRAMGTETTRRAIAVALGLPYDSLVGKPDPESQLGMLLYDDSDPFDLPTTTDFKNWLSHVFLEGDSSSLSRELGLMELPSSELVVIADAEMPRDGAWYVVEVDGALQLACCRIRPKEGTFLVFPDDFREVEDWPDPMIHGRVLAKIELL